MVGCQCAVCKSADKKDKRLRSSIMIQSATTSLVVDTGPDFRYQMLRENDHLAGLDDIRAFNYFQKKPIDVFADALTEEAVRRDFYYAFADTKYPGIPELNLHTITLEPFMIGDIPVTPILVWHLKMPVMGFRFGAFTYITDANRIDETEKQKIIGSQVLVLNALRKEKHISHFTLQEAIDMVTELGIPAAYFTHISHQLGLHASINTSLIESMQLAFDGLKISI
jgi:phosphoribosyl 1,2-cyclic phosphate phosphodiesterase